MLFSLRNRSKTSNLTKRRCFSLSLLSGSSSGRESTTASPISILLGYNLWLKMTTYKSPTAFHAIRSFLTSLSKTPRTMMKIRNQRRTEGSPRPSRLTSDNETRTSLRTWSWVRTLSLRRSVLMELTRTQLSRSCLTLMSTLKASTMMPTWLISQLEATFFTSLLCTLIKNLTGRARSQALDSNSSRILPIDFRCLIAGTFTILRSTQLMWFKTLLSSLINVTWKSFVVWLITISSSLCSLELPMTWIILALTMLSRLKWSQNLLYSTMTSLCLSITMQLVSSSF